MSGPARSYLPEAPSFEPGLAPGRASSLAAALHGLPLERLLPEAVEHFEPGRLAVVSAFGPGSLVLLHVLHQVGIRLPVIFIDTLHHFPETLQLVERVRERYDLDLRVFKSYDSREEFEAQHGPRLWERDLDLYQQISKVEPFRRATAELDAWFTGRRREQSETRAELPLVEDRPQLRINPLANWTRSEVWRYIL